MSKPKHRPVTMNPTPERSELMARVRQRGTAPELIVRQILRRRGFRYRTNARTLPGSPDVMDPRGKLVIFVHGCFWHRHARCRACTSPRHNADFWQIKFSENVRRDRRNRRELRQLGYRVIVVWECQTKSPSKRARLERRLDRFFVSSQ